jgi:fumarate hydratase class II
MGESGHQTRIERDSMGEMAVPSDAMYGASTARAVENFPISNLRFPREFIWALGLIKKHAATTNAELKLLDPAIADAITQAAAEVQAGQWDSQFVLDIFQTGSGTSTNMNANEVIAYRATQLLNNKTRVHPNDHVNLGQSSNDVIPSAIHIAAMGSLREKLLPSLRLLHAELHRKSKEFWDVLKIGRTHLQDATPIRLGQEFSGYARQVELAIHRLESCEPRLGALPLGGTAVGTGINTHPKFAQLTIGRIAEVAGPLHEANNHFEAQGARDGVVELSGALKTTAISLLKIANDIRFLASGPRLGYGELKLPATQPGSSIMPGKVNPVMAEMLMQVCAQVMGNDTTITVAASHGNFELNAMMPVMAHNLLQSISILSTGAETFGRRAVAGLEANREHCEAGIERSLAMCTSLAPLIGYDKAAEIAKIAHNTGRNVREVAKEISGLDEATLTRALDPLNQVEPRNPEERKK